MPALNFWIQACNNGSEASPDDRLIKPSIWNFWKF